MGARLKNATKKAKRLRHRKTRDKARAAQTTKSSDKTQIDRNR
jgi:hypothetical protein